MIHADDIFNFPSPAAAIAAINARMAGLAPVLNSPTLANKRGQRSQPRRHADQRDGQAIWWATDIFAVAVLDHPGTATFASASPSVRSGTVQVLDENRRLAVFQRCLPDAFTGYGVQFYQMSGN